MDEKGNVIFSDPTVEQAIRDCLSVPEGPGYEKSSWPGWAANIKCCYLSAPEPATLDLSLLQLCTKLKLLISGRRHARRLERDRHAERHDVLLGSQPEPD